MPNQTANSITVVRASTGVVLATIQTINQPMSAAFDGERILVVGNDPMAKIYKAADLTLITTRFSALNGDPPFGSCSDGLKFFYTIPGQHGLAAF